jgi:hypothetical protein
MKFTSIFTDTFWQIRISHGWHTEIHIALKYTAPWCTTLCTNYSWEQMANGADNCCLLLTNHELPHCLPCNIIPSSSPQVNYFPLFQMLLAVRHADSSAKFVCALHQGVHQPPWSAEPWTRSTVKILLICVCMCMLCRKEMKRWKKLSKKIHC